jgi:hypothetical protein
MLSGPGDSNGIQQFEVVQLHHINESFGCSLLIWKLRPLIKNGLCFSKNKLKIIKPTLAKASFRPSVIKAIWFLISFILLFMVLQTALKPSSLPLT